MGYFKPCWSCGSTGECYSGCECLKCFDPEGYRNWKEDCPEEYEDWKESQKEYDPEDVN